MDQIAQITEKSIHIKVRSDSSPLYSAKLICRQTFIYYKQQDDSR